LIVVGHACHPTGKRAFSPWAQQTTLGALAGVDLDPLTSQHFWKQMDQVPVPVSILLERDIFSAVLSRFPMAQDTLLFDATNFFTFIASTTTRIPMAAHSRQKRNDLCQIGVAVLYSRTASISLWRCTYGGNIADVKTVFHGHPAHAAAAGGTGL
jgi:transposase